MNIVLSEIDKQKIKRLGKSLDSGVLPFRDVREFLTTLERKIEKESNPVKNNRRESRKDKYRMKLKKAS